MQHVISFDLFQLILFWVVKEVISIFDNRCRARPIKVIHAVLVQKINFYKPLEM